MGESSQLSKLEKEIARFTGSNNMQLQSNKEYVAKLEVKKKELLQVGKNQPEPVKPETAPPVDVPVSKVPNSEKKNKEAAPVAPSAAAPVSLKATSIKSELLIANEPVTPDKPLSKTQLAAIGLGIEFGNNFPKEVMEKYTKQKASLAAPIAPTSKPAVDAEIPVDKAATGGIFDGPGKNSVMLNNNNMAANDILTSIRESFGQVQKKSVESELPKLTKINTMIPTGRSSSRSNSMDILDRFTDIMEQKMSDVIDAISDNNNIKEEILLYSKV